MVYGNSVDALSVTWYDLTVKKRPDKGNFNKMIKKILISEKNYIADMQEIVVPYLGSRKTEGYFKGPDGRALHYVSYRADREKAAVVISHGFTESCFKYDEMAYYFLKNNYSVFIPDHRGHGLSYRQISDMTLTHIDRFSEYVDDFQVFIKDIVHPACHTPLYLFAHSMGGAVGLLFILRHRNIFEKAVLSSPMIIPDTGLLPITAGRIITRLFILMGKSQTRSFTSGEYPGFEKFEDYCASSPARFEYYEQKRRAAPYLQNYSPTYGWINESLRIGKDLMKKKAPESIEIPVYIFSAESDTVVRTSPHRELAKRLKNGKLKIVGGAKHEIFLSGDSILEEYVSEILRFWAES